MLTLIGAATPACLADRYEQPLVGGTGGGRLAYQDLQRIVQNLSKNTQNQNTTDGRKGPITFTLYPDGSVKWPHRNLAYSNCKDIDQDYFKLAIAAIAKAVPLHPSVATARTRPARCNLFLNFADGHLDLDGGFEDVVVASQYFYKRNSAPLSQEKWICGNLAKIKLNISANQRKTIQASDGIVAIWFNLNPNGLLDDWQIVSIEGKSAKRLPYCHSAANALVKCLQRAQPLEYRGSAEEPEGPREHLLIFDAAAKDNFKLSVARFHGPNLRVVIEN
jgi:hypothetical protein